MKKIIVSFSKDFFLSTLATIISIGVMQFLLFPKLAKVLSIETYGLVLTIIATVNIITAAFGSELGYSKMITFEKYRLEGINGDFSIFLFLSSFISVIIFFIITFIYFPISAKETILGAILVFLIIIKAYYATAFRLTVQYGKILFTSVLSAIGYFVGAFLLDFGFNWLFPFLFAEVMSLIFVILHSDLWKEPFIKTKLLKSTLKVYLLLMISSFLNNLLSYLDRFLIFPLLGAEAVSIYSTSALLGKSLALLMLPLSGVFLSYLVGERINIDRKIFVQINISIVFLVFLFSLGSFIFGLKVTSFLYPTIKEFAKPYIFLANIGAIISIAPSISRIVVLKLAPTYWQVLLSVSGIFVYILISYYFINLYGLIGFCWAVIITNILRAIQVTLLGLYYLKEKPLIK